MSSKQNTTIGGNSLILGSNSGSDDFNIVGTNGRDIKINGIVPSDSGGGVPAVGDVSFIGNLAVNNTGVGGVKGEITFEGTDIYHQQLVNPGDPIPAPLSYVDYKQLAEKNENQRFVGQNDFAERVRIQLSDGANPPNYTDKITFNTSGNIQCNDINASLGLVSNSLICENGAVEDQLVKAREYHFRPSATETTGWKFSQKPPDNPAIPEDNYLMLQNTQATGSLNLVKSTFDPQNPTPFDIILDPQNGQVKTATSFDAPQVNFRKNAVDNWSISQPPAGDVAAGTLIARAPSTTGAFNIFDSASSPWAQFSSLATTLPKPTTINNTLNVNGNVTLGNTNNLLFGAYSFRPIQYSLNLASFPINATPNNFTKIFTSTSNFTIINTGATNQQLVKGFYKLSVSQTSLSTPVGSYDDLGILCDFVYRVPTDALPNTQLPNPLSFSYGKYLTSDAPSIEIRRNATGGQDVHMIFPSSGTGGESMNITVKLTKMDF